MKMSNNESDANIVIKQAKHGIVCIFGFHDKYLRYSKKTSRREIVFDIPYERINMLSLTQLTNHNTSLAVKMCIAGIIVGFVAVSCGDTDAPFMMIVAFSAIATCLLSIVAANRWTRWLSMGFTLIGMTAPPPGAIEPLTIIHNNRHDRVLETLRFKWKERMRQLHGRANLDTHPKAEAARLEWLHENGILNELEYREEISKLHIEQIEFKADFRSVN